MSKPTATHERLTRHEHIEGSSDRSFGFVFAIVFAVVGLWPLVSGETAGWWWLAASLVFAALGLIRPSLLRPLNRLWTRFGLLLSKVVNPVVMALLYYVTVTPTGLLMRAFGKDPLRLRFERESKSYWIERSPPGPVPETMKYQF